MNELETLIRSLAKSGRLNHLSVGHDSATGGWFASYRGVLDADKRMVTHEDPASALLSALTGRKIEPPPKPKRIAPKAKTPTPLAPVADDDEDDLL